MFHHTKHKNLYIPDPVILEIISFKMDQQTSVTLTVHRQLVKSCLSVFQKSVCPSVHPFISEVL